MKRHCFIVFFLLMFLLLPSAEAFSLQTVDGDVREVLRSAARMGGINLVLDDTVRGKVTIELQEVAPEEAIRLIALARGFSLTRSGSTLRTTATATKSSSMRKSSAAPQASTMASIGRQTKQKTKRPAPSGR